MAFDNADVSSADLYYGGEAFSVEQPQAFTCPYCGKMGYTETSLQEHVTAKHPETSTEVVSGHILISITSNQLGIPEALAQFPNHYLLNILGNKPPSTDKAITHEGA